MHWLLFVWLIGSNGMAESGWLAMDTEAQCQAKRSWYLQRLELSDGSKAQGWVVECVEVGR